MVWLHCQKHLLRKEVKKQLIAGIDRTDLVLLKFTKKQANNLKWEHSKEFEYRDQMYDVVEAEWKGDSVYYWCWWDHEETRLNKQLAQLVREVWGHHPENKETQHRLIVFFKSLFCSAIPQWTAFSKSPQKATRSFHPPLYTSIILPPPVPPPIVG